MTEHPHMPRVKLQHGTESHLRQVPPIQVPEIEQQPLKYLALALVHLRNAFARVPVMLQDYSRPFDVYNTQTLIPTSEMTISLQPAYEVPERIESIIITGPPAATVTLQLADRFWPIVIPATGVFVMVTVALWVNRGDVRQLTAGVAGSYSLELMGHADSRGNLV